MGSLIRPFLELCVLRLRPQDLPASGVLLGIVLAAYALSTVALSALELDPGRAMLAGLVDTALLCAMTASLLALQRLVARLVQTLTALAGASTVITLIAFPFFHVASAEPGPGSASGIASNVLLLLVVWSVAVFGHILRHALSAPYFVGLVVAVVFYLVSSAVFLSIFSPGA